MGSNALG
jgi:alpha-tubulin suppressor-like RCC1 family protein